MMEISKSTTGHQELRKGWGMVLFLCQACFRWFLAAVNCHSFAWNCRLVIQVLLVEATYCD